MNRCLAIALACLALAGCEDVRGTLLEPIPSLRGTVVNLERGATPEIRAEALRQLERHAATGNVNALQRVALIYQGTDEVEADYAKVAAAYEALQDRGFAWVRSSLARIYSDPDLGQLNPARAAMFYEELIAESSGDTTDLRRKLGELYAQPQYDIHDPARAVAIYEQLMAEGDRTATIRLVRLYTEEGGAFFDMDKAVAALQVLRASGDEFWTLELASIYDDERSGYTDRAQALAIYTELAARQNNIAALRLARIYANSSRPEYDPDRALRLYQEMAAREYSTALVDLGDIYLRNDLVRRDPVTAYSYYERAMNTGSALAKTRVAIALLMGRGTSRDTQRGTRLLTEAAREGDVYAHTYMAGSLRQTWISYLQERLAEDGLYTGPINGRVDAATQIAFDTSCARRNITASCAAGIGSVDAARAFARSL